MQNTHKALSRISEFLSLLHSYNDFYLKKSVIKELRNKWYAIKKSLPPNHNLAENQMYQNFVLLSHDIKDRFSKRNAQFVEHELVRYRGFFNDIEGKSLSLEQRKIAIQYDDNNLIIACAGSGKTLTILGSVKYLLEKGVAQDEILILSFNKKIASEIRDRFTKLGLNINTFTFHKLGLTMIDKEPKPELFYGNSEDKENLSNLKKFENQFLIFMLNDEHRVKLLLQYVCYNMKFFKDPFGATLGDLYRASNQENLITIKGYWEQYLDKNNLTEQEQVEGKAAKQYERVKHLGEWIVANYLFLNGTEYEYRKKEFSKDHSFTPSFYLPNKSSNPNIKTAPIWIDYFNNFTEAEKKEYKKRVRLFKEYDSTLIPIYLEDSLSGDFSSALDRLRNSNIQKGKKVLDQLLKETEFLRNLDLFRELIKKLNIILKLYKGQNYKSKDFGEVENRIRQNLSVEPEKDRNIRLLRIFKLYYEEYQKFCKENNLIDFEDMLILAIESENTPNFKYIFVDEFQDTSKVRFELLDKIKRHNKSFLSVIGDDWQSIYRFTGCNINLFTKFDEFVGKSNRLDLSQTYRYSTELAEFAKTFIEENPAQFKKAARSDKKLDTPIIYVEYDQSKNCSNFENTLYSKFISALDYAIAQNKNKGIEIAQVLVLGRNNRDLDNLPLNKEQEAGEEEYVDVKNLGFVQDVHDKNKFTHPSYPKINFEYSTIHRAKGREADLVFVLNNRDSTSGFPNKMDADPFHGYIIDILDEYPYAEERRLFYVAITRTKSFTVLMVPHDSPSVFVENIRINSFVKVLSYHSDKDIKLPRCPYCESGRMLLFKNSNTQKLFSKCEFKSCKGNQESSDNMIIDVDKFLLCPKCDAPLIRRKNTGDGTGFLGCINFHSLGCRYTSDERGNTVSEELNPPNDK